MFVGIKSYFSTGYWTSTDALQKMAYASMPRQERPVEDEVYNPNQAASFRDPKQDAEHKILTNLGWSLQQKWRFNPFRVYFTYCVRNAVKVAFAARKFEMARQMAADSDLSSYQILARKPEYKNYFTREELGRITRIDRVFLKEIQRFQGADTLKKKSRAYSLLFNEIKKESNRVRENYLRAKEEINKKYQLDKLGIDIEKEVFHAIYPNWIAPPDWKEILEGTDPNRCLNELNRLFGDGLPFIKDFLRRALSSQEVPLTDGQIDQILNPYKIQAIEQDGSVSNAVATSRGVIAFLKKLRWPAVKDLHKNFAPYTYLFYLLKNDISVPAQRTTNAYIGFLQSLHSTLWNKLTTDSFGTFSTKREAELKRNFKHLVETTDKPLWEMLLESSHLGSPGAIKTGVDYLDMMNEIRGMNGDARPIANAAEVLRGSCPSFYAYLQRKKNFTDKELNAVFHKLQKEIKDASLSNLEKLKYTALKFLSEIHLLDKNIRPVFQPYTEEEKRQFLRSDLDQHLQLKKVAFASELDIAAHQLHRDYERDPYLPFVASSLERELLRNNDEILKSSARFYRAKLKNALEIPGKPLQTPDEMIRVGVAQLSADGKMTRQMEADVARLSLTTIIRKEGYLRPSEKTYNYEGNHDASQQAQFLSELDELSKRLTNREPADLYTLQEMASQSSQNYVTYVLMQKLKRENCLFKPFPLQPLLVKQELREIDATHIELRQSYQYNLRDHLNFTNGLPEQDTHSFDVTFTFVKEGNRRRVELKKWKYNESPLREVAERLEAGVAQPDVGGFGSKIWNGIKYAATPVTTPAGWLWNGMGRLARILG